MINNNFDPRRQPQIAVCHLPEACYPHQPPFHPSVNYPEYRGPCSDESNQAYAGVREVLFRLGLDTSHFGTQDWNPLGELIQPGNHVLIKPNLIRAPFEGETVWECVVTHASVIRAVLDYVTIALQGNGQVTIVDGPETEQNFDTICQRSGLYEVLEFYRKNTPLMIDLVDIRNEHWVDKDGVIIQRIKNRGDPLGSVTVDLGYQSCFANVSPKRRFYGAYYDIPETNRSHRNGHHLYSFSRSALSADVVINLPKMKTHKKTGITLSLKNLVGLNTHRNYLPHYTMGFPKQGGDQYKAWSVKRQFEAIILNTIKPVLLHAPTWVLELFGVMKNSSEAIFQSTRKVVRSGNWYGNDTAWRMVLDLNKVFFYFDQNGRQQRNLRSI